MSLLKSFACFKAFRIFHSCLCLCVFLFFFKIHWHFEFWACVCYLLFEMFSGNCFSSTLNRYGIPKCNQEAEPMHSPAHFTTYLSFDRRQPANCSYVLFLFALNSMNFLFDYGAGISFQWGCHQNSFNVPIGATSSAICVFFFHLVLKLDVLEIKFHPKKKTRGDRGDRVQLSSGDHHHHGSSMCFSIEISNRPQSKSTTKIVSDVMKTETAPKMKYQTEIRYVCMSYSGCDQK